MDHNLILSLLDSQKGFISPAISQYHVESHDTQIAWETLFSRLTPLDKDDTLVQNAVAYGDSMEADGFINGFRIAVHLLAGL